MILSQTFRRLMYVTSPGVLIGAAFLHPLLWWLVLVGGVLFLHLVTTATTTKQVLFIGWVVGTIKTLVVLSWFWSSYPMGWMGFSSPVLQVVLILIYWLPAAFTIGSGYVLLAGAMYQVRNWSLPKQVGVAASSWVLADLLGALVFSFYTLGPGSVINASFSFGFFGYPLAAHTVLILFAGFGGVYALTAVTAVLVVAGYALLRQQQCYLTIGVLLCFVVSSQMTLFSSAQGTDQGYTVAVVNTSFDKGLSMRGADWTHRQSVMYKASRAVSDQSVTHIIFPEDNRYGELLPPTIYERSYAPRFGEKVIVVDTGRVDTATSTSLRAFVTDVAVNETYSYDKQYLVPQGEYVPYVYQLLMRVFGMNDRLVEVVEGTNYQPGPTLETEVIPVHIPPVLFCFESVNPLGVRSVLRGSQGAPPFVAHAVSHAWFNNRPQVLWHQLDLMLRTQAVWNRVPIVQAANEADNKVYWPSGQSEVLPADLSGKGWYISFLSL